MVNRCIRARIVYCTLMHNAWPFWARNLYSHVLGLYIWSMFIAFCHGYSYCVRCRWNRIFIERQRTQFVSPMINFSRDRCMWLSLNPLSLVTWFSFVQDDISTSRALQTRPAFLAVFISGAAYTQVFALYNYWVQRWHGRRWLSLTRWKYIIYYVTARLWLLYSRPSAWLSSVVWRALILYW